MTDIYGVPGQHELKFLRPVLPSSGLNLKCRRTTTTVFHPRGVHAPFQTLDMITEGFRDKAMQGSPLLE